jgi:hypothetical protein
VRPGGKVIAVLDERRLLVLNDVSSLPIGETRWSRVPGAAGPWPMHMPVAETAVQSLLTSTSPSVCRGFSSRLSSSPN